MRFDRRWRFLTSASASFVALLVVALACTGPAHSQKDKVHRVAWISGVSPLSNLKGPDRIDPAARAFANRLRELGYVEARNLRLDSYTLGGNFERIPEVLAEIVRSKADVIFTPVQLVAEKHLPATEGIPLVVLATWNLVGTPAVQSLARPGGSVTGFMGDVDLGVESKRLEVLRETVPRVKRIAYLGTSLYWESPAGKNVRDAAQRLGLSVFHAAYTGTEIKTASAIIERQAPEAVFVPVGVSSFANRQQIGEFVSAKGLPCIAGFKEIVESGCLMSYGVDSIELIRNAAGYVAKILEGAKAGDLPIQQPTKFELVVNLKTAKALGIKIPQSILVRADRVIE